MKYSVVIIIMILSLLGLSMIYIHTQPGAQIERKRDQFTYSQLDDDPIIIENNTEFEIQGWPGNGTSSDPYLIENQRIQAIDGYYGYYGIHVYYTDVFFIIRNCTIVTPDHSAGYAIRMLNVANARIENCNVTVEETGYEISEPYIYGIYISQSGNVNVSNCVVEGVTYGIQTHRSTECSIKYNKLIGRYGIRVIISNETVVQENNVVGLENRYSHTGIMIWEYPVNCSVVSNNITGFRASGIRLHATREVFVSRNNVTHSGYGIYLSISNTSQIQYNRLIDNDKGIVVDDTSHHNTISNNILENIDDNTWDDGYDNDWSFNWFSDYGGVGFYIISGSAKTIDTSPKPTSLQIPNFINKIMILFLISLIPLGAAVGYYMRYEEIDEDKMGKEPALFFMVISILIPFGVSSSPLLDPSVPNLKYVISDILFTLGVSRSPGNDWVVSSILSPNDYLFIVSGPYLIGCVFSIILLLGYLRKKISERIFSVVILSMIVVLMLVANLVSILLVPITPLLALSIVFWATRMGLNQDEKSES